MMEGTQLGSTEIQGFQNQHNAAKLLLRQNYVNQYKNYYDGGFNLQRWRSQVFTRLRRVNKSWDDQYSSFGEFRENCRKVTFNDDVKLHDYILDSEFEGEMTNDSAGENENCNIVSSNPFTQIDIQNPNSENEPAKLELVPIIPELPEDFINFEEVVTLPPLSTMTNEMVTPKSDSAPNLAATTDIINELDLKTSLSDTIMIGDDSKMAKKSPKNRVGTPRYLNRSSYHNSPDIWQIMEIGSNGTGDEINKNKNIDVNAMKVIKAEERDILCIPIHPSTTKLKLTTIFEGEGDTDTEFQSTSPDQLPSESLSMSQDPIKEHESGSESINPQDEIDENQVSFIIGSTEPNPPVKGSKKGKRISKSRSDIKNNKSQKKDGKPMKKEKPATLYVRRENARIQGQRLFYEIKDQISRYNVDKKILSTIFNKQFLALLLSAESMQKYRTGLNSNPNVNWEQPKSPSNKVITLGSKWASKPVENLRTAAIIKPSPVALPHIAPKRSKDNKLNVEKAKLTPILKKEKVENKKSKPELQNRSVSTENMKLPALSTSSPRKKESPKKEMKGKRQKHSTSQSPEKVVEKNAEVQKKVASLKNREPKIEDLMDGNKFETKKEVIKDRMPFPTKIPKPISKIIDRRTNQVSAEQKRSSATKEKMVDLLKKNPSARRSDSPERPFTAPPTNPLDYKSFDKWLTESKKVENSKTSSNADMHTWKLSVGDERELKILRSIKRNPQMLDAYTTYRFGGPLSPTELDRIMKRF